MPFCGALKVNAFVFVDNKSANEECCMHEMSVHVGCTLYFPFNECSNNLPV